MVEMPNMSSYEHLQEHFKVIETVVKKAAGRIHVIGGAGGNCTKKVRTARKYGYRCQNLITHTHTHQRTHAHTHTHTGCGSNTEVQGSGLHSCPLCHPLLQQAHAGCAALVSLPARFSLVSLNGML
jgi:hypothetical protein